MVGPFPGVSYSFGVLHQIHGPLFVRCDVCRRYAHLDLAEIRNTNYRTKTFSCSRCGAGGALAITEPSTESGMTDYQLDQVEWPQHHPAAVARLLRRDRPLDWRLALVRFSSMLSRRAEQPAPIASTGPWI
jgi:hypothetical protein